MRSKGKIYSNMLSRIESERVVGFLRSDTRTSPCSIPSHPKGGCIPCTSRGSERRLSDQKSRAPEQLAASKRDTSGDPPQRPGTAEITESSLATQLSLLKQSYWGLQYDMLPWDPNPLDGSPAECTDDPRFSEFTKEGKSLERL